MALDYIQTIATPSIFAPYWVRVSVVLLTYPHIFHCSNFILRLLVSIERMG
jgi:hypothetical protein